MNIFIAPTSLQSNNSSGEKLSLHYVEKGTCYSVRTVQTSPSHLNIELLFQILLHGENGNMCFFFKCKTNPHKNTYFRNCV